jgi:cytoskeletal protein CcmA (bactofilin family)
MNNMSKQNTPSSPAQINMISAGTEVEGTLRAKDDIRISGRIKGTLHVEGKAIIAPDGVVDGDIHASEADISGTVNGEVKVKGRLVLKTSARVEGGIKTSRLIMEEGAVFEGNCEMGQLDKNRVKALDDEPAGSKKPSTPNHPAAVVN